MERNVLLCVFTLCCQAALTVALMCPSGFRPYPCSMCLRVTASNEVQSFETAQTECQNENGGLVPFSDSNQFETLKRYIQVLGAPSSAYWVGYQYDSTGMPVDANNNQMIGQQASAILNDMSNFVTGETAGDGVCVAINNEGLLQNLNCAMTMPYICANIYLEPNVTITATSNSPVTDGSSVTINCTASGNGVTRTVLRKDGMEAFGMTNSTLTIDSFADDPYAGTYDCLVENPIGMALSQGLRLDTSTNPGSALMISSLDSSPSSPIVLGSTVTLTCTFNVQGSVSWFVDGLELTDSTNITIITGTTTSMLRINTFHQPGVYQCRVSTSTFASAIESLVLCGRDGFPGPIDSLFGVSETQVSINISWIPPIFMNTSDPLLLRYVILSHVSNTSNEMFSFDLAMETEVKPTANGDMLSTILSGLEVGTLYAVAIRAQSSAGAGSNSERYVLVSTYGRPPSRVQNLVVSRTPSNNTLVAFWLLVESTLPTGQVVRYEIQYRNLGQNLTNSRLQPPTFGYTVIDNVVNASSYEVRVRASVEIQREPVMYGHSEWTDWEPVSSVIDPTDVPPVPPTDPGPLTPINDARIAVAVVVPVVVVVAIVVLILLAICVFISVRNKKNQLTEKKDTHQPEDTQDDKPINN